MKSKKPLPKGAAKTNSTKKPKTTVAPEKLLLNARQSRFVAEYLIDLNATQAAIRAGYSKKTAKEIGSRLLTNVHVAAAVQSAKDQRVNRLEITQDRILKELARIALFDIRGLYQPDGKLKPIHELDDDTAAALVSVESLEEFEGVGKDRKFVGLTQKVKIADKVQSIRLAMQHMNMLTEKLMLGGDPDNPTPIPVASNGKEFESLRAKMAKFAVPA